MAQIALLDQQTIDKIAAGEVVERPSSVVKELVENAIDAGASAVTVEIKDGGTALIRITDNGCGIEKEQVPLAFLRHSTSKIRTVEDLMAVSSLGFRGEALSSIAAVSRVELITKTKQQLTGTRYLIEGSKEVSSEEVGAPDGTTFLVKDLFYNTPARKKFLRTPQTEGTYISDLVEKLALSHPDVSFKYISNNQTKLHTSGNGSTKDLIYHIFGRDITSALLPVECRGEFFQVSGFIGKPEVTRANRNLENYFINRRYIKSNLIAKAIEEAYKGFIMQHQYPFTVLYFTFDGKFLDVNVHPSKMELRFGNNNEIYSELYGIIQKTLAHKDLIPEVPVTGDKGKKLQHHIYKEPIPEPFEKRRLNDLRKSVAKDSPYSLQYPQREQNGQDKQNSFPQRSKKAVADYDGKGSTSHRLGMGVMEDTKVYKASSGEAKSPIEESGSSQKETEDYEEMTLASVQPGFLTEEAQTSHRIIGQLFETYWLVEYGEKLYIIDQHAAHEKVLYERTMAHLKEKECTSQMISPPIILSLDATEVQMLEKYRAQIEQLGYVVEHFGGKEYKISGVPGNLFHLDMKDLFIEMLDDFATLSAGQPPQMILEKVASMSCKAAVKGNDKLSLSEAEELINELLSLENPYNCPHGRPTVISMTKYELEKKFKRIVT